jgi:hypothetical protein
VSNEAVACSSLVDMWLKVVKNNFAFSLHKVSEVDLSEEQPFYDHVRSVGHKQT